MEQENFESIYDAVENNGQNKFQSHVAEYDISDRNGLRDIAIACILNKRNLMMNHLISAGIFQHLQNSTQIHEVFYEACLNNFMWKDIFPFINNINTPNEDGEFPIEAAVMSSDIELLTFLLDHGATITYGTFIEALYAEDIPVLNILLKNSHQSSLKPNNLRDLFQEMRDFGVLHSNNDIVELCNTYKLQ